MSRARRDARSVALDVLARVRRDRAYANLALSAALDRARLPPRERGLATELVYGVLRHRARLDHAIAQHSTRPPERINADVLDILRLAAYQLLVLDRVPAHAAVNEAVNAARRARGARVAGFANAVLRKVAAAAETADEETAWGPLPEEPLARTALRCSLPQSLAELLRARLVDEGDPAGADGELERLGVALLAPRPITARCNPRRCDREGLAARLREEGASVESTTRAPWGLLVRGLDDPFRSGSYLEGLWTAQDEAAQLAVAALDLPDPVVGDAAGGAAPARVLDACAGVGGKATLIAALLGERGEVLAADSSERKLELLAEHCRRLGLGVRSREVDLTDQAALADEQPFDRILLDAPCSALGLIGRQPELKWRFERAKVDELAALQRALLAALAPRLRPGGMLVYSVCTVSREEGPDQVRWAAEQLGLEPVAPPPHVAGAEEYRGGSLALWPHRHGTDGFFIARLRRGTTIAA